MFDPGTPLFAARLARSGFVFYIASLQLFVAKPSEGFILLLSGKLGTVELGAHRWVESSPFY